MIVIRIELWPDGEEENKRHLGTGIIINTGGGTRRRSNYAYMLSQRNNPSKAWREGQLLNWPRESYNLWQMLRHILNQESNSIGKS